MTFHTFLICFDIHKLLANEGQTTFPSLLSKVRKLSITKTSQSRFAGSGFLSDKTLWVQGKSGRPRESQRCWCCSSLCSSFHSVKPCPGLALNTQLIIFTAFHLLNSVLRGFPHSKISWQTLLSCSLPAPGLQTAASKPTCQLCKG